MILGAFVAQTGVHVLGGLHPEDREAAEAGVRALFDEEHLTHEFRFRHRDGTYRWIRDEQRLLRDAMEAPVEIVGSWSDITERKRAELKLAESEEQFRAVFDGAIDAKVVTDDDGRFLEVNPAACELYGCPRAELLKRKGLIVTFPEPPRHLLVSHALVDWLVKGVRRAVPLVEWLATVGE